MDTLTTICAWCGVTMRHGQGPISHGICEPCAAKMLPGGH